MINSSHVTGFLVGVAATLGGLYYYEKNKDQIDAFLANQGLKFSGNTKGSKEPNLQELMRQKERLEDLIAERLAREEAQTGTETAS
jgi:hypothetical protein